MLFSSFLHYVPSSPNLSLHSLLIILCSSFPKVVHSFLIPSSSLPSPFHPIHNHIPSLCSSPTSLPLPIRYVNAIPVKTSLLCLSIVHSTARQVPLEAKRPCPIVWAKRGRRWRFCINVLPFSGQWVSWWASVKSV